MSTLTPEAAAVVDAATQLIDHLQRDARDIALGQVLVLQRVLADLEVIERRKHAEQLRKGIDRAAGLALTHDWAVVNNSIECTRCPVTVVTDALRRGTVPTCNPNTRCASYSGRHLIVDGRCIHCETTYPATADTEEV